MDSAVLVEEYRQQRPTFLAFAQRLGTLCEQLLHNGLRPLHSVTHRAKAVESLAGKLNRPGKDYRSLAEVSDLAGVRITTFFADDVDRVAETIEAELLIDRERSIDKRALDPERFGYASLHYVVSLGATRDQLPEYSAFAGLKCEIQIRSVLQHAWAEIEHDLGYKSPHGVPSEIRRRFSRLAGLLELADSEFVGIRDQLEHYRDQLPARLAVERSTVSIDADSLTVLVAQNLRVQKLDAEVATAGHAVVLSSTPYGHDRLASQLHFLGITTVAELELELSKREDELRRFISKWVKPGFTKDYLPGVSLFFLCYLLVVAKFDGVGIERYLRKFGIGSDKDRSALASRLQAVVRSL